MNEQARSGKGVVAIDEESTAVDENRHSVKDRIDDDRDPSENSKGK
jgi:hypothetical protein